MHELSLARAIVEIVDRHAEGRRVGTVRVRVGGMRQVVPASLRFGFEILARGSACDGARLEIETVTPRARCQACAGEWELSSPDPRCPRCLRPSAELVCGEELEVESIDVLEEVG